MLIMDIKYTWIHRQGNFFRLFKLITYPFIGQFVHPVGGDTVNTTLSEYMEIWFNIQVRVHPFCLHI